MILRQVVSMASFQAAKMGKLNLCGGDFLFAGLNCFEPGQQHEPHSHQDQDKIYFVLEGSGETSVGDQKAVVKPGDLVFARAGEMHSMSNPGPGRLVVMVLMGPPPVAKK